MNWKSIICLAAIGLLVAGCGKKSTAPTEEGDYERYFGKKLPVPSDRSIRISGRSAGSGVGGGSLIDVEAMIFNGSNRARSLPIGIESSSGFSYSYFSALVRNEAGEIKRVTFPAVEGDLVSIDVDPNEIAGETLPISDIYEFTQPGRYEVVIFYSVGKGELPNGEQPDWTGTVWTSPIVLNVQ